MMMIDDDRCSMIDDDDDDDDKDAVLAVCPSQRPQHVNMDHNVEVTRRSS